MPKMLERDTGVYLITNVANQKVYVGSAAFSLTKRIRWHRERLSKGLHNNVHLQRAWEKYGAICFDFTILLRCPPEECLKNEQLYMDKLKAADPEFGYNVNPIAGSNLGRVWSLETRQKSSGTRKGKLKTPEHRAKIAAALKGKKKSAEHIEKITAKKRGRKRAWRDRAGGE